MAAHRLSEQLMTCRTRAAASQLLVCPKPTLSPAACPDANWVSEEKLDWRSSADACLEVEELEWDSDSDYEYDYDDDWESAQALKKLVMASSAAAEGRTDHLSWTDLERSCCKLDESNIRIAAVDLTSARDDGSGVLCRFQVESGEEVGPAEGLFCSLALHALPRQGSTSSAKDSTWSFASSSTMSHVSLRTVTSTASSPVGSGNQPPKEPYRCPPGSLTRHDSTAVRPTSITEETLTPPAVLLPRTGDLMQKKRRGFMQVPNGKAGDLPAHFRAGRNKAGNPRNQRP